jgi:hypothetical protein
MRRDDDTSTYTFPSAEKNFALWVGLGGGAPIAVSIMANNDNARFRNSRVDVREMMVKWPCLGSGEEGSGRVAMVGV